MHGVFTVTEEKKEWNDVLTLAKLNYVMSCGDGANDMV
jgi:hypothetical protein